MFRSSRWRRHPSDRGMPANRALGAAFRFLLETKTWKRHPAPFSKIERGRRRHAERHFVISQKRAFV